MSKPPREWNISNYGADDYIDGPVIDSADAVPVIEKSAYDALAAQLAALQDTPGGKRLYGALNRIAELEVQLAEALKANHIALSSAPYKRIERLEAQLAEAKSFDLTAAVLAKDVELNEKVKLLERALTNVRLYLGEGIWADLFGKERGK